MGIIPGQLIPGPEPIRRRYGLLTAASGPVDLPSPHARGGGVRYVPVTCGTAHPYPITCYGGAVDAPRGGKPRDDDSGEMEARPFIVLASINCGALGYTDIENEDRVRRRLANGEQGAAEYALWTGTDASGNGLDIVSLADGATDVPVIGGDITSVVSELEQWAYGTQGYGNVAYLHAPVSVVSWAADAELVVPDGPFLRTPYGSVWIFGGGYPGTGEAGADPPAGGAYIHVTGQVTVWRDPTIFVYPPKDVMDRETNQILLVAEREYAVGFDCVNGRVLFDPWGVS